MSVWEMLVIMLVAIVVIKPERLPEIAYLLGSFITRCRLWYEQFFASFKNLS